MITLGFIQSIRYNRIIAYHKVSYRIISTHNLANHINKNKNRI
jgi:hypothetical protein